MIVRYCAGGVVFYANKVLLVKNDRGEWTLPKGKIHQDELKHSSAVSRVKDETGVEASILETAGNTMYQFFSRSRQQEVCNAITWYIMQSDSNNYVLKDEFNCLFCYCPLYTLGKNCGGNFKYTDKGIKNCSDCLLPHNKNNYNYIMSKFQDIIKITKIND